jgi:hypothetical protein
MTSHDRHDDELIAETVWADEVRRTAAAVEAAQAELQRLRSQGASGDTIWRAGVEARLAAIELRLAELALRLQMEEHGRT